MKDHALEMFETATAERKLVRAQNERMQISMQDMVIMMPGREFNCCAHCPPSNMGQQSPFQYFSSQSQQTEAEIECALWMAEQSSMGIW